MKVLQQKKMKILPLRNDDFVWQRAPRSRKLALAAF